MTRIISQTPAHTGDKLDYGWLEAHCDSYRVLRRYTVERQSVKQAYIKKYPNAQFVQLSKDQSNGKDDRIS